MQTSSAKPNDFVEPSVSLLSHERKKIDPQATASADQSVPSALNVHSFPPSTWAHTARLAGRVNAASVSDMEHKELLEERQTLLDRELSGEISRRELIRLEYIRWSLDRIEDAKYGPAIDSLEDYVSKYEHLLSELQSLQTKLQAAMRSGNVRRR